MKRQITSFKFLLFLFIGQYVFGFIVTPVVFFAFSKLLNASEYIPYVIAENSLFFAAFLAAFLAIFFAGLLMSRRYVLPQSPSRLACIAALVAGTFTLGGMIVVGLMGFGMGPSINPLLMLTLPLVWATVLGSTFAQGTAVFLSAHFFGTRNV